jgi:hypothetical protein
MWQGLELESKSLLGFGIYNSGNRWKIWTTPSLALVKKNTDWNVKREANVGEIRVLPREPVQNSQNLEEDPARLGSRPQW